MRTMLMTGLALLMFGVPAIATAQHEGHMRTMTAPAQKSAPDRLFISYEEARLAFLNESLTGAQRAARHIGLAAESADQRAIARHAVTLEKAADLKTAREAFASLSEAVIKYRQSRCCERPVVAYCSMEKKSWLQPAGMSISNPYLDVSMRKCGEFVKDEAAHQNQRH